MSIRYIIILLLYCGVLACGKPTTDPQPTADDSTTITDPPKPNRPVYKLDSTERFFSGYYADYFKMSTSSRNDTTTYENYPLYFTVQNDTLIDIYLYYQGERNKHPTPFTLDTTDKKNYPYIQDYNNPNIIHYSNLYYYTNKHIYYDTLSNKVVLYLNRFSRHTVSGTYGHRFEEKTYRLSEK